MIKITKKIFLLSLVIISHSVTFSQNVDVVASAGTATASYFSVSNAFAKINDGTHKGVITLTIKNNTFEATNPTVLVASGVGFASYTSILITVSGNRTIIGQPISGRGLLYLNGADDVTIDGDDPNTPGLRNLTFSMSTASSLRTSCIRIGSPSALDPATNITIKNCKFIGSRPSIASGTDNYGIVVSGNSATNPIVQGWNSSDINIDSNEFERSHIAIAIYGGNNGDKFENISIVNNKIGQNTSNSSKIGQSGIEVRDCGNGISDRCLIKENEISVGVTTTTGHTDDSRGIHVIGGCSNILIEKNNIHDIINNTTSGSWIIGIDINGNGSNNAIIQNNFIRNVIGRRRATNDATPANYGIRANLSDDLTIRNNTIALNTLNVQGTVTDFFCGGALIDGAATIKEFANNLIVNKNSSQNAYAVYFANINTSKLTTSVIDNNCYYTPNGSIGNSTVPKDLTNWQLTSGYDGNSFVENPPFISTTDLHIQGGKATKLESGGAVLAIGEDIDGDLRPGPTGSTNGGALNIDVGADEFDGIIIKEAKIITVSHSPNTQSCLSAIKTITANIEKGNAIDSVILEYSFDNGTKVVKTIDTLPNGLYTGTIPAAFPANAIVRYRVYCLLSTGDTVSSNYGYYNDFTASNALMPTFQSVPTSACNGSTVSLEYNFEPDPTGSSLPQKVIDSLSFFDITKVYVGTLDNSSSVNSLNGTIGNASGKIGAYSDYTLSQTDSFDIGKGYPIVLHSKSLQASKCYFSVFIDINGDGDFEDDYENPLNTFRVAQPDTFFIERGNIYIPPNARPGKTTLRIVAGPAKINNPYSTIGFGEVEDYSIYINPLTYTWKSGATVLGTGNPQSATFATVPASYNLEVKDLNNCIKNSSTKSITVAASAFTAKIVGALKQCYNTTQNLSVDITGGGCPPFTYEWNNNPALNSSTYSLNIQKDTVQIIVKVTSFNNFISIDTVYVYPNNPLLTTIDLEQYICNRGKGKLIATNMLNDTTFWYDNANANPYDYIFRGDTFITKILDTSTFYYAAAFASVKQTVGKEDLSGNDALSNQTMKGLTFNTREPITITKCKIYGSGSGTQIKVAVLDKYGTIVSITPNIHVSFGANTTTAVEIPLDLFVPNPGSGYKLVLFEELNLTGMRASSSGYTYPISNTKAMVITDGYNQINASDKNYSYFYDIELIKDLCVGEKNSIQAIVTPARVPKIFKDLEYTQICRGDTLKLNIETDSIADYLYWFKDGIQIFNTEGGNFTDSFYSDSFTLANTVFSDTGEYQATVNSSQFCTRDTFTRIIRVDFYPEVNITKDLEDLHLCIISDGTLKIEAEFADTFQWFKDNSSLTNNTTEQLNLNNVDYINGGKYKVVMNDKHRCREVTSNEINVIIVDTPTHVSTGVNDTICEGENIKIYNKISNATDYVWYKDGGILPFNVEDSIIVWGANVNDSGTYQLKGYSYPGCPDAWSNLTHVKVNPTPKKFDFLKNVKICDGDKFTLYSNAINYTEIEWYKGNDLFSTGDSININPVNLASSGTYSYRAKAFNKCTDLNSNTFDLNVISKARITGTFPNSFSRCEGDQLIENLANIGGNIFQWYKDGFPIQSQTKNELVFENLTKKDEGKYQLKLTSDEVCPEVSSTEFTLNIVATPKIISNIQSSNTKLCDGNNIELSIDANDTRTYNWYRDGVQVSSNTSNTFSIPNAQSSNSGKYSVELVGVAPCPNPLNSDSIEITVLSSVNNVALTRISEYNTQEQCTDGQGWTYYAPQNEPNRFIFAVKKNGNNFKGTADIIVKPTVYRSISNTGQGFDATFMMQRMWNLNIDTGLMNNPIEIKFYFDTSERTELIRKVEDLETTTNNEVKRLRPDITWFKTDTLPFSNDLLGLISGQNLNFSNLEIYPSEEGTDNGVSYIVFENVNEAGGGSGYFKMEGSTRFITSIHDIEATISPLIIPNPNNGNFRLEVLTKNYGDMEIDIYNSIGQRVYSEVIKNANNKFDHNINLESMASGIYYLRLKQEDNVSNLRFEIAK